MHSISKPAIHNLRGRPLLDAMTPEQLEERVIDILRTAKDRREADVRMGPKKKGAKSPPPKPPARRAAT